MGGEFVECVRLLEEKNGLRFVFKGNGLEKKSDKTKKDIGSLEEAIAELQNWNLRMESVFSYFGLAFCFYSIIKQYNKK